MNRTLFAIALLALMSIGVGAHPHVWIENRSDVLFDDQGKVIGLNIAWVFDGDYSQAAVDGLDINKDGYYSASELDILGRENIAALKDYDYFVYTRLDGKKVAYDPVTEFGQIYNNGVLKMYFTVPFAQPVDPKAGKLVFRVYDPSFYIAIDFAGKDPLAILGAAPKGCKLDLGEIPADAEISQTKKMLSEKDQDWVPETEQDFGALFAQPVTVDCNQKTSLR